MSATAKPDKPSGLTYGAYLEVEQLLSLQKCRSTDPATGEAEHDELLFIVIHQVYELWFKEVLHELDALVGNLDGDDVAAGGHRLKRVLTILKTLVGQLDVLETMTPLEFASFRSFLETSSGFQSAQFRELEFLLGQKDTDHLRYFEDSPAELERLRRRLAEPTIWDAFAALLARRGLAVPADVLDRDIASPVVESPGLQEVLLDVYRNNPELTALCELLTDFDEGLQEWRYRHVKMVQRTIGTQIGTGGSDGASYLWSTLGQPVFADLWAIRARF
ncbi:MAG: tryptophan 2,3-dioxygenase family protein [Actinomycetota bacterium]|nr:tryptophan 2,3-dioxygenase family protein [Actinomycetota bacterium]